MYLDLGWQGLKLLKLLLEHIRLLDLVYESPITLLAHPLSIVWPVSMVTPCDLIASPHALLQAAGLAHLVKIRLPDHVGTPVHHGLCFPLLTGALFPPLLKLALVAVFAEALGVVLSVLMATDEHLVWHLHHVFALLTEVREGCASR